MGIEHLIGQKLLLAFEGKRELSAEIRRALRVYLPAGVTLFRYLNLEKPEQVRQITVQLQNEASALGLPRLLIAADQEGGQLMAIGEEVTPLPGNMALGATRSPDLARRAGQVLGRELAALGININYAPCVDVNNNPRNPVIGVRSFGEDPALVAEMSVAMVQGIQSQGVAATAKHFPGHGDTTTDSHHSLGSLSHNLERLRSVELQPFRAVIAAGVQLIMSAHLAVPALDGPNAPPATLSARVLQNLLRQELRFQGVIISDAMDMCAIRKDQLESESVRAVQAGIDLLLLSANSADQQRVYVGLIEAARKQLLNETEIRASANRIRALRSWINKHWKQPPLEVIGCPEHQQIAQEIAERSITLVRKQSELLPLRPRSHERILVILPRPANLTPADTSADIIPSLAHFIRQYHPAVDEVLVPFSPKPNDISALREQACNYDYLIIGTLNAFELPAQQALVQALLEIDTPTILVALRLPYDLAVFPKAKNYFCTYSILEPSRRALVKTIFGELEPVGQLPVSIPELLPA